MATMLPMYRISINGGPEAEGRLAQWSEGGLMNWDGDVNGYHAVGEEVTVMVWGPKVLLGRAMLTSCEVVAGGTPVSRFQGNGPLRSFTHKQLEEILSALPDEE
jgi:hypothetical protein